MASEQGPVSIEREVLSIDQEVAALPTSPEFDASLVTELGKAIDAYKQIISLSIKLTNPHDWSSLGGRPYLQSSGAEKIASPFKISMGAPTRERLERDDSKGKYYLWIYQAVFTSGLLRRSIVAQGKCSSRDQFFGRDKEGYKLIEDVDEENILQSAYTNLFVNGVTRLLGIRNLTWEQLALGGIAQDAVGKVDYRKGGQGGGQSEAASSSFLSQPQLKLLFARVAAAKIDPSKDLLDHLEVMKLPRDVNKIPKERFDELLKWIEAKSKETPFL